jgi:hypothetical protein
VSDLWLGSGRDLETPMPQHLMTPHAHRWRTLVPVLCCALLATACARSIQGRVGQAKEW